MLYKRHFGAKVKYIDLHVSRWVIHHFYEIAGVVISVYIPGGLDPRILFFMTNLAIMPYPVRFEPLLPHLLTFITSECQRFVLLCNVAPGLSFRLKIHILGAGL